MPESPITLVAQAVVDALNAGTYSQSFVATRAYRVAPELNDPKVLRVAVVPRGIEYGVIGRGAVQTEIQIDIGIHKKVELTMGPLDAAMALVEEIALSLRVPQLFGVYQWVSTANVPIYSPDHLDQAKEFLSILTVTFRAVVAR